MKQNRRAISFLVIFALQRQDKDYRKMTAACCVTTNPLFYHIYRTVDNMQNGVHRLSDELVRLRALGDVPDTKPDTESELDDKEESLIYIPKFNDKSIISTAEQDTSPKEEDAVIDNDSSPVQEVSAFAEVTREPALDKVPISALGIDSDIVGNFLASKRRIKVLKKELIKEEKLHNVYAEGIFAKLTELGDDSEEDHCD